jgi:hypothetical protein
MERISRGTLQIDTIKTIPNSTFAFLASSAFMMAAFCCCRRLGAPARNSYKHSLRLYTWRVILIVYMLTSLLSTQYTKKTASLKKWTKRLWKSNGPRSPLFLNCLLKFQRYKNYGKFQRNISNIIMQPYTNIATQNTLISTSWADSYLVNKNIQNWNFLLYFFI